MKGCDIVGLSSYFLRKEAEKVCNDDYEAITQILLNLEQLKKDLTEYKEKRKELAHKCISSYLAFVRAIDKMDWEKEVKESEPHDTNGDTTM